MPVESFKVLMSGKGWGDILQLLKKKKIKITVAQTKPIHGIRRSLLLSHKGFESECKYEPTTPGEQSFSRVVLLDHPDDRNHMMRWAKEHGNLLPEKEVVTNILKSTEEIINLKLNYPTPGKRWEE